MKYVSCRNNSRLFTLEYAINAGLAPDGGLFMPAEYPRISHLRLKNKAYTSFTEMAFSLAKPYLDDDIDDHEISNIVNKAFSFDIPLKQIRDGIYVLELFHGPTLAFKDLGARFMAELLSSLNNENRRITILVATSGDTGGAVASGFYDLDNIKVIVLYPRGKVSRFQERQFTTLGKNIDCLAVEGTFDDCQYLVKEAFSDTGLREKLNLSSANSINIARWLPQSFYYAWGMIKWLEEKPDILPLVSVPSGNYGNLTAGMLSYQCGIPFSGFLAASNINNTVPVYLRSGVFEPKESIETITNSMDVGNPSNFERMKYIGGSLKNINEMVSSFEFKDHEILTGIEKVYDETGYILDPHSATGYLALKKSGRMGFFTATAHPVKFLDILPENIRNRVELPPHYKEPDNEGYSTEIQADYHQFRDYLLKGRDER